jgi:hypothetical protein
MRMIILSALFAVGVGLVGTTGASAAPGVPGLAPAANSSSMLQDVQYYRRHYRRDRCRTVRVCRFGPYGRRCHLERICR